jgi:hypothetical protein
MDPHRISVKLYLDDPAGLDPEAVVSPFHRYIREDLVVGTPIDVARYAHVVNGPGILIIGHQLDYAIDYAEGRAGISVTRKRDAGGTFAEQVRDLAGEAARLSLLLQGEDGIGDAGRVGTGEALVTILDRYEAPNDDETLLRVDPALREAFEPLSESATVDAVRVGTSREPFAARVAITSPRPLEHWAEGSAALAS